MPKSASRLQFSDKHLNLMVQYVRKFLDDTFDWYHLVISRPLHDDRWTVPISGQDEMNLYHYIRACPKNTFKDKLWLKYDNVVEKCASQIKDPLQFVYTLIRISNLPNTSDHYKLPPYSLWILASLWKEGLQTVKKIALRMNEKLPPETICFPVQKIFRPTKKASTKYFLYLKDGSRLNFEKDKRLLDLKNEEWTQLQLELGNRLN